MRPLVLWDIDGTLMRGDGAVVGQFLRALGEVYELGDEIRRIEYGGKTDGQIVLETLALHELDEAAALERLPHFGERYHALVREIEHRLHESLRLLPGVKQAIEAVRMRGAIQTLLTGNLEPIAELKLGTFGLDRMLDLSIGAYGSDDRDRLKLVPVARAKAAARYGEAIGPVIVVGDTPRDIACGKAGGARTVAVATGHYDRPSLEVCEPDTVLDDLGDTIAAVEAILGRNDER